jgi:molecular chaperone GrpE
MVKEEQSESLQKSSEPPTETSDRVAEDQQVADSTETVAELKGKIEALQHELKQAQAKAEENWNRLLRTQAELENQRKRSQRALENAHKYAIEKFVAELLPVYDSLELGLSHSAEEADAKKLHEGMELTLKMLAQAMEKFNVEQVNPEHQPFDPELHQAMTVQENAELPPNTVMAVVQKGYLLNDRLIRPAMVIVSKQP